ncbi:alpha/beta hydrolase [Nocardioides sp. TRM66260-LWL]|uniref:alpha/beta hydrolase fold domain-containing protein n=1 Tax=Nocardioides sp. TRM66260-LWL TaxID=2874478 RepID=UPI001CC35B0F|nr:alpha/beta hydrolase fold domain-containing protein [Nocardioides sp. TRM66260-LWL]MBZ5734084.1 alpha/beta hydrolase [Nocardioides sp. TRM66260-LWL]
MPTTVHPLSEPDRAVMAATRELLSSLPALPLAPESRPAYDEMIARTPTLDGARHEPGELAGVPGWWSRVEGAPTDTALLYLHGGGYVLGSAEAYRGAVGQLAARAGVDAFAPDYALAPENAFPGALDDAVAVYDALVAQGRTRIALAGDSAGGGLALALLAQVRDRAVPPVVVAVVSPWTDLSLSGASLATRADADPLLDRTRLAEAAAAYLVATDPTTPAASPLFGPLEAPVPILIHVGADEVLLDDAIRYAERAEQAGAEVDLHVWEGMLHVFTSNVASLEAAVRATDHLGGFLATHLLDAAAGAR